MLERVILPLLWTGEVVAVELGFARGRREEFEGLLGGVRIVQGSEILLSG